MKKKLISLMISLSMLTAAMPAVFAMPENADGESAAAASVVTETEVSEETESGEETDTVVPEDGTADAAESEPQTAEPETADTAETAVPEEPDTAAETAAPELTEVTETAVPEETTEAAAEPGISLMSTVDSGTCGDNLTWTLDDSGMLTISGTGEMTDYIGSNDTIPSYSDSMPWCINRLNITAVVIEDGVTSIGNFAFNHCYFLTSITIPDSVTSIGSDAFAYCYSLTSITIPDSVTSIGSDAFNHCHDLTSITIPGSVTFIDSYAFANCDALTSVSIGSGITSINSSAFYSCSALTDIYYNGTYADFLNISGKNAFSGKALHCTDLEAAEWGVCGDNITYVLDSSGTLTISGAGKMSWTTSTWYGHSGIKAVVIEDGVTSIGRYAFYACYSLTSITIPDSVTSIGEYAFYACDALTSITIPDSVTSIGSDAFYRCSALTSVYIMDLAAYLNIDFGNAAANPMCYADELYINGSKVTGELTIPNGVTTIPTYAFKSQDITSVYIPDSVTSIGEDAFRYCTALTSITIPDSVTSIGNWAFYECTALTSITIPDSVTSIGSYAFENCAALTSITIPNSVTSIGNYAFSGCYALTSVYITDIAAWCGITFDDPYSNPMYYAKNMYVDGEPVTELVIPDGVTSIGYSAFRGCSALTSITIPDSVTSIGSYAFYYTAYYNDDSNWENGILYINNCLIDAGTDITECTVKDGCKIIADDAFYNCSALADVYYNGSLSDFAKISIGSSNSAFTGATLHCGDTVYETWGKCGASLAYHLDDSGTLTISGTGEMTNYSYSSDAPWYSSRSSITSVVIEDGVTSIGNDAFEDCSALTDVYYNGSLSDFAKISIGSSNSAFTGATLHCGDTVYETWGKCGASLAYHLDDSGTLTISGTGEMTDYISPWYSSRSNITSVVIEDSATSIGEYAFYYCTALTSVSIGSGVTSIGSFAFEDCDALTDIYYNGTYNDLMNISGISNLPNINLHCTDTIITTRGTCGYDLIWTLDDSGTLTISGTGKMLDYSSTSVPWYSSRSSITSVVIEDGVTSIVSSAFAYCDVLASITIPNSVTSIGSNVFSGCDALTDIYYDGSYTDFMNVSGSDALLGLTVHFTDTEAVRWGTCGDNVTWALDSSGVLTISGTGEMADYNTEETPSYTENNITSVIINNGITHIGSNAFYNLSALTSVTIPESVVSIGSSAFAGCTGLSSLSLSDGLSEIGDSAFAGCTALTNIIIPGSVSTIGNSAFSGCTELVSLSLSDGLGEIGDNAFAGCTALTDVAVPGSVGTIGNNAFSGCTELASLSLSDGLREIDDNAFAECSSLTDIDIPETVVTIGAGAFNNCSGFTSIIIPEGVTSIGAGAFEDCSALTSVTVSENVKEIGEDAFYNCSNLTSMYITDLAAYLDTEYGNNRSNPMYYADRLYINNIRVTNIDIPYGVTAIPAYAFSGCDGLRKVTIPDSVQSIGAYAFSGCLSLGSIEIPGSVASIGNNAFFNCSGMINLELGSGIESIGIMAFDGCSSLKKIEIPDSVTSIRQGAFNNCSGLLEMTLPFAGGSPTPSNEDEGMFAYIFYLHGNTAWIPPNLRRVELTNTETIPQKAFYNCGRITEIIIPDTVKTIESMAFDSCSALRSIELPDALTSIGYSAFFGCSSLTEITMGDNVTSIGNNAFGACSGLRNVTIGSNVTTIGNGAFTGCSGLTSITIPENVESIGSIAFGNCRNLISLNYNASDCTVSENWLGGSNGITYFNYPPLMYLRTGESVNRISAGFMEDRSTLLSVILSSNTTTIDTDAFSDCTELRRLYIPRSVTEIEMGAFENCTSLIAVEYGGSENDWQNIYIGANNECLTNAQINYNSLAENAEITDADLLTYITNDNNTLTITNCYEDAVNIDIPAEIDGMPVMAINSSAFANRANLESVTIPASVTSIGDHAFDGCTALSEIVIPDGVASVANSAFYGCSSLENITIPVSVTSIADYAFYGCTALTDVYYAGSEEQWQAVSVGYSNTPLTNAAVYYNGTMPEPEPTPLPMTTAEITKTDTETGYVFEVTPETAYEGCVVYAAVYDENGVLIALSQVPLSTEGSTSIEVGRSENDSRAAVFIWADTSQPIVTEAEFSLI